MLHMNKSLGTPVLDGKPLIVDVTRTGSRTIFVDHSNSSFVVAIDASRSRRRKTELLKNGTKIFGSFSSSNSRIKFTFSTTEGTAGL